MPESLLIKNATLVWGGRTKEADLYVTGGKIAAVGTNLSEKAEETIDAKGLHLLPGACDPQVHFREPGAEWKEDLSSGARACAAGGITSFFDMPNNSPSITTAELMAEKKKRAAEKCMVNYNFFIGATRENLDQINNVKNVCGIKIFMGSSTGNLLVSEYKDLEHIFKNGRRLIAVHAEDEKIIQANMKKYAGSDDVKTHMKIRSPEAALKATTNAVTLSKKYQRRLHILHLTTKDEVTFLRKEKVAGLISTEVCPQHLLLQAPEAYDKLGTLAQMNPPIRDKSHTEGLWQGLTDGIIDCIATDHAPHTKQEKDLGYSKAPSGMPGVETSMALMLNQVNLGRIKITDVAHWMCEAPYRLYGVKNKGALAAGYDADLVLIDLKREKEVQNGTLNTKVNWSPFNGVMLKGWPIITIVGGQIAFREGELFKDVRGKEIAIDPEWERA